MSTKQSPFVNKEKKELVIKEDKKLESFGKNGGPKWRFIGKGLNLFGLCTNSKCPAYNDEVTCMMGHKYFNIQDELELLKCSECNKPLEPHYDLGFFDCKCRLRGKRFIEQKGEKVIVELVDEYFEAPNDKWVKFVCQNYYKWQILVIEVTKSNQSTEVDDDKVIDYNNGIIGEFK